MVQVVQFTVLQACEKHSVCQLYLSAHMTTAYLKHPNWLCLAVDQFF